MIIVSTQDFPPASGGKQTLMESLAREAAKLHPVSVLADLSRNSDPDRKPKNPLYKLEWFSGLKILRQMRKARRIVKLVNQNAVTHVFCDSWHSAKFLPPSLPCPVIVYAHGNEYPLKPSFNKKRRIHKTLEKVDHIVAVSSQTGERVEDFLTNQGKGKNKPQLHVKPNPVAPPDTPSVDDESYAETLWPSQGTRLLVLCRLVDWKGIDMAIKALHALTLAGKDAQMVIAGTGPYQEHLEALVKECGLDQRVTFAGRVEGGRKSALYQSADIYVQAGRKVGDQCEGFGITYIEAGLFALPSISGKEGGAPDAVLNGDTGFVVDGEKLDKIVIALQRLIDEPDMASHMGNAAQVRAQSLLWPHQIGDLLALT